MSVFFCYAHEDKDFADELAAQLVRNRVWVWLDRWELNVGDSLVERVQQAIERASAIIAILSPSSVGSRWVQRELSSAIYRTLSGKDLMILPVLIEDCAIPSFVADRKYADFRTSFDEGLRVVLEALARVTSETQGRFETPPFHTDWAFDWSDRDSRVAFTITMIDHSHDIPFCVLTTVEILGDEGATSRYKAFAERRLEWIQHEALIQFAADAARDHDIRFRLQDQRPQVSAFGLADPSRCVHYQFNVSSRWVGTDTGKDVVVDVAGSLAGVVADRSSRVRRPTTAEMAEFTELLGELR